MAASLCLKGLPLRNASVSLCKDTHVLVGFALHFFCQISRFLFLLLLQLIFLFSLSLLLLLNASNTSHISCIPQTGRAGAFRGLLRVDWGKWGPSVLRWTASCDRRAAVAPSASGGSLGISADPCNSLPSFLSFAAFLLAFHTSHMRCGEGITTPWTT